MYLAGEMLGLPAIRVERKDFNPLRQHESRLSVTVRAEPATLDVAGFSWPCTLVTETWTDEDIPTVRKTWCSGAAPVYGVLKSERYDADRLVAFMYLLDFGPRPSPAVP